MDLKKIKKSLKQKKGFTLVELIVVLVILAILAAILVPALTGYIDKANQKVVITEARSALLALQTIASDEYSVAPANRRFADGPALVTAIQAGNSANADFVSLGGGINPAFVTAITLDANFRVSALTYSQGTGGWQVAYTVTNGAGAFGTPTKV